MKLCKIMQPRFEKNSAKRWTRNECVINNCKVSYHNSDNIPNSTFENCVWAFQNNGVL